MSVSAVTESEVMASYVTEIQVTIGLKVFQGPGLSCEVDVANLIYNNLPYRTSCYFEALVAFLKVSDFMGVRS